MSEINTAELAKQMIREDAVLIESGSFEIDDKKYRIIIELKEILNQEDKENE